MLSAPLPRPDNGERIEVRVFVDGFSEDELIVRINRCGSRSVAAEEGDAA